MFSFGVILLELVTGRHPNEGDENSSLAEWAWRHIREEKQIIDAIDEDIKEPFYINDITRVFKLGIFCTHTLPANRPTMKDVLQVLLRCSNPMSPVEKKEKSDAVPLLLNNSTRQKNLLNNDDDDDDNDTTSFSSFV